MSNRKFTFHCKEKHHRNLCPTLFPTNNIEQNIAITINVMKDQRKNLNGEESLILAASDEVIMETALVEAINPDTSISESSRIMMDNGSQITCVTEKIVKSYEYEMKTPNEFQSLFLEPVNQRKR